MSSTSLSTAERRYLEEEARAGADFFTRRAARELLSESTLSSPHTRAPVSFLPPGAKRATHFGRIRTSVCVLSALICSVLAFQAGTASWASGARNSFSTLSRGLGLFGARSYARPAGHAFGGDGGGSNDGPVSAGPPPRERVRSSALLSSSDTVKKSTTTTSAPTDYEPPSYLASLLPNGPGAIDDEPGSHPWLTHQECWASADESEGCLYTGPFCTDGDLVYVSAREGQYAWPPVPEKARATSWPPPWNQFSNTACWDTRTMEATTGCGYSDAIDRGVSSDGGGAGTGPFWTTPLESRMDRGLWGPASSLTSVVPLHWTVMANALHAGLHTLADPSAHLVKLGKEWESPVDGGTDVEAALMAAASANCGGGGSKNEDNKVKAIQAPGAKGKPALELHWLDGALYTTHMAVGWMGHPWHFSTAAFPFWTAKRRNATALHVARGREGTKHVGDIGKDHDNDDGSATREMLLTNGGPTHLPPMKYASFLMGPKFEGLEDDGAMKGNLGHETPGRKGRGIADMGSWQRGVWRLLSQPPDEEGNGGTTLITRRTMALALGVGPTHSGKPPTYIGQSPRSLYDARLVCAADVPPPEEAQESWKKSFTEEAECHKSDSGEKKPCEKEDRPLPRLMCSAHGGVIFGLQPRLFAGTADANAFRVAAWARAGVLQARSDAAKADDLRVATSQARGLDAKAAMNSDRLGIESRANAFLRGKKKKESLVLNNINGSGASASGDASGTVSKVRWWDVYPPRHITVVTRQGTRSLMPKRPLRALLKHVGLPVRWMGGLGTRTWDEQVAVMSGTGIFIGAHGGDFAGLPFLPPSAAVIEAFPYLMDHEGYRHLAEVTGARYTRLAAPAPTHPTTIEGPPSPSWPTSVPPPLSMPSDLNERTDVWKTSAFEPLFAKPDFERFCEDPQRVSSLDAALLVACNGRSKNSAVELDWPPLVTAIVNALDDIGCRPRQFSAGAARAIRAAQKEAGLVDTLWENWEELADAKARPADDPLGLPPASGDGGGAAFDRGGLVGDILRAVGLEDVDVGEADWREELWGGEAGVFENFDALLGKQHNVTALHLMPGVPLSYLRLEEIHLVPVTGGDGFEGAQAPYINVRAKCAPRERGWRDKSPW